MRTKASWLDALKGILEEEPRRPREVSNEPTPSTMQKVQKPREEASGEVVDISTRADLPGALTADEVLSEISRPGSGPAKTAMLYYDSGEISWEDAVQWVTCAILYRRGESTDDWERHAPAVREVLASLPTTRRGDE